MYDFQECEFGVYLHFAITGKVFDLTLTKLKAK